MCSAATFPQGVALGWVNCLAFGPNRLGDEIVSPENLATHLEVDAISPSPTRPKD
jgi:hypothetical protein